MEGGEETTRALEEGEENVVSSFVGDVRSVEPRACRPEKREERIESDGNLFLSVSLITCLIIK